MIRRPPRSTQSRSSAASDVYKRQRHTGVIGAAPWARHSRTGGRRLESGSTADTRTAYRHRPAWPSRPSCCFLVLGAGLGGATLAGLSVNPATAGYVFGAAAVLIPAALIVLVILYR